MDKIVPAVKALLPLIFTVAAAFGLELTPELKAVIADNFIAVTVGVVALASAFPSIRAALKFGKDAK